MAKICMIAYTFYRSDPRVRREAEALAARGDEVDFICIRDGKHTASEELMGVRLYPLSVDRYQGDAALRYLWEYINFFVRSTFFVAYMFFKRRYDIIHVHTMPDFLVFAALIPKLFGAKIILDVHDLVPELYVCKFCKYKRAGPIVIRFITWVERCSIAFAHRAISVHIPHRDALVKHGNPLDKFEIVMNVPDPRIFEDSPAPEPQGTKKFRIIYHGMVGQRHGLEIAVRALHSIREQVPNLEFLVIGFGDDLPRIKALVAELKMETHIRFQGRVAVNELPKYLAAAHLGVIPLIEDEFTRYMLPLKLFEYVHFGIPAIATRTHTIRTYFDEKMIRFVPSGDIRALAHGILELYGDPEKCRQLATNASHFNSRYNWETQRETLFELVDSLLGVKRPVVELELTA